MLSRLISLLRRIPAVKWAFTRLRPVQHGSSIAAIPATDVAPVIAQATTIQDSAAQVSAAQVIEAQDIAAQDIGEAASAQVAEVSRASVRDQAEIAAAAPCAEDDAAMSSIAECTPAAPTEVGPSDDSCRQIPSDIEPVVAADTPSPVDVEIAPVEASILVMDDERSTDDIEEFEPAIDEPCAISADAEGPVEPVSGNDFDRDVPTGDEAAIEPAAADMAASVAEQVSTDAPGIIADIAPAPALVSPAADLRSPPKVGGRPAEPADRNALIRQRWAESGIRMWNPRLHGTGEATLNIQGSVGLLPPAPGETMPRYDKLEFKLLGGQIVCEGVIVEAPAQASQRSFTRLAEPGNVERVREPARERQAALA